MSYGATPQHKNLCLGYHIIYNFCRLLLGHHYYTFSLTEPCPKVEKMIFKEINQFYTFYPKVSQVT